MPFHAGTLPVLNEQAVEYGVRAGLSLNCEIPNYSKLDRKGYFYPDLAKGIPDIIIRLSAVLPWRGGGGNGRRKA